MAEDVSEEALCDQCGEPIETPVKYQCRTFCSDKCREYWDDYEEYNDE